MMKTLHMLFMTVIMAILSSCSYILDKEQISGLNTNKFWQTDSDINSAVADMYVSFALAMSRGYYDWGEVRGRCYQPYQSALLMQTGI